MLMVIDRLFLMRLMPCWLMRRYCLYWKSHQKCIVPSSYVQIKLYLKKNPFLSISTDDSFDNYKIIVKPFTKVNVIDLGIYMYVSNYFWLHTHVSTVVESSIEITGSKERGKRCPKRQLSAKWAKWEIAEWNEAKISKDWSTNISSGWYCLEILDDFWKTKFDQKI